MRYKMVQPPLAVASVHFVFCLVYLSSEGGAAVGDFCTDVSYWDVLKYQTTIKQCCKTKIKQRCTFKSDHVCKKVPEIQCEVVSWPLCESTPTLTESKKCEVRYQDYSYIHCKDVKSSITHTKKVPECREITRENCVTDWKVDAKGNKVWGGKETCTPVRWEECGIVERQVELPMMRTYCSAASIIKWADIVDRTKHVTGLKTQCQVKSSVDCKKKTVTKCASVSWEECSMIPAEECQPVEVYTPSQEKIHRKNCFNPNAAAVTAAKKTAPPHNIQFDTPSRAALQTDCSCSTFTNDNGFGQCKKENSRYGGSLTCYVNTPSNCIDLLESGTNPGKFSSAEACKRKSAIDGGWTEFSDWSSCSKSCGVGNKVRSRTCANPPPSFGGEDCQGQSWEVQTCVEIENCRSSNHTEQRGKRSKRETSNNNMPEILVLPIDIHLSSSWNKKYRKEKKGGKGKAKEILGDVQKLFLDPSLETKIDIRLNPKIKNSYIDRDLKYLDDLKDGLKKFEVEARSKGSLKHVSVYLTATRYGPKRAKGLHNKSFICDESKTLVMARWYNEDKQFIQTVAHEIGHALGFFHDFIVDEDEDEKTKTDKKTKTEFGRSKTCGKNGNKVNNRRGNYLMNYSKTRRLDKWSECTTEDFRRYYGSVTSQGSIFCLKAITAAKKTAPPHNIQFGTPSRAALQTGQPVYFIAGGRGAKRDISVYHPTVDNVACSISPPTLNNDWQHHTTFYHDNTVHMCGGHYTVSTCISHNKYTAGWKTHTLTTSRWYGHSSVVLHNRVYFIGGWDSSANYNGASSTPLPLTYRPVFTPVHNLDYKGWGQCTAKIDQDTLVVTGGYYGSSYLTTVATYNVRTRTYKQLPSLKQPRRDHGCGVLERGNAKWIIVAGGIGDGGKLQSTEMLQLGRRQWRTIGNLNMARGEHSMAVTQRGVMVMGGLNNNWNTLSSVELLDWDSAGKKWSVVEPSLNKGRYSFGGAVEIPASMFGCTG